MTQQEKNAIPDFLRVSDVAKILRVSILTVKRWEYKGPYSLKPIRINARGDRRYRKDDVFRIIEGA